MVLNAAVQMLREAEELKQNILKFKSDTSMLQERSLWSLQQQLQKIYQKVLVLDLDYALDKKVEQDLWFLGFKQQIDALQTISKDRKSPLRSESAAVLSWVLQASTGFYLSLLHQICTAFKLDLPFRRRASLLGWVEGWSPSPAPSGPKLPPPAAARYICQHCLVHLGDLARYRQQPRVAYTFYRHALVVSPHSGQPYNQLALLARRRGRRLDALYWHVRAILVRAPFPPAPLNLTRTLEALAGASAPVAPALLPGRINTSASAPPPPRDTHAHVTLLVRVVHDIHTGERLEAAELLVETLNASLTSLVATDSFEAMTLMKMICVIIWLVNSTTDELTATEQALSESESKAAELSLTLAVGTLLALLTPSHTADSPLARALPALKVCLEWVLSYPQLIQSAPFASRPQLWHALAHTLNKLPNEETDKCESVPLPEDEELHGFQPLERSHQDLKFSNHAAWDTYGRCIPEFDEKPLDQDVPPPSVVSPDCLGSDPESEAGVRAHRLMKLGFRFAELAPENLSVTVEDNTTLFTALCHGGDLTCVDATRRASQDAPPPVIISEADFREKVRDQRIGILKPQGSLERAREERALATAGDQDLEELGVFRECAGDDKREARRPRVNIAMAAILRKQEESCKQVKFKTPPPLAEETNTTADKDAAAADTSLLDRPKPQTMQPRPQKSLAQIPVGRKTGGILALKDKSGYPHLVDIPPEPKRKEEKQPEKDPKVIQPPSQKSQGKWNQQAFEQRAGQRNYGLQSAGISYNPQYNPQANIRLSVVNPKEIDVRSAALQKQNARADPRDKGYMSSDKRQFLNDLPPRFANQRWAQEEENKFRDDEYRVQNIPIEGSLFNQPPNWYAMPPPLLQPQLSMQPPQLIPQLGMPQMPGQIGHMSHQPQIPQYPPPLMSNLIPNFWKSEYPQSSNANPTQFYSSGSFGQLSQIPQTRKPEQNLMRPTAIGQMPRHITPPGYNMPGLGFFDQYGMQQRNFLDHGLQTNRSFLEEKSYPPLDLGSVPLDLSSTALPRYERRELDQPQSTPSPLDLSMPSDETISVGRESPPMDPGTYSLFSGAPGAVTWSNVAQSQQGSSEWMIPQYEPWQPFALHPPLPAVRPTSPPPSPPNNPPPSPPNNPLPSPPTKGKRTGKAAKGAVKPPHPYSRPF